MFIRCLLCDGEVHQHPLFCKSCIKDIGLRLVSRSAGHSLVRLMRVNYWGLYGGQWAELIKNLKSKSPRNISEDEGHFLQALVEHYASLLNSTDFDCVIPVPGHPLRLLRETNLAQIVAEKVARTHKKPLLEAVEQRKNLFNFLSPSQKDKVPRGRTIWDANKKFRLKWKSPGLVRALLVDDVCTTGETLQAVKSVLCAGGYEVHGALVMAISPQFSDLGTFYRSHERVC